MPIQELKNAFCFPKDPPPVPPSDHGWFGPEHVELLSGAVGPDVKVILELGSWMGKSTRFFAERCPNAVVFAVDHWQGSMEHHTTPEWRALLPTLYETFLKNCWDFKDRIVPLRMGTVAGMSLLHQHGVKPDLIFIDAGHDYPNANADVSTALRLFPESTLCGDDFMWEGVQRAVVEHVRAGILKAFVKHNVWWKENRVFAGIQPAAQVA